MRILKAWMLVVLIFVSARSANANDDACNNLGRIGSMLGQLHSQCPGYKLTGEGNRVRLDMAARLVPLGAERCLTKGKAAMLRELAEMYPLLDVAARSKNQLRFRKALCAAIASYLGTLAIATNPQPLFEKSE